MNRDWYKTLTWLMWLVLPVTALNYWTAWDQLPARMAVHFDANNHPNGFTSREGAVMLGLGIMGVMLILCTVAALVARALKASASWPVLVVSYVVLGSVWYGNHAIVEFNLKTQPAHSELVSGSGEGCSPRGLKPAWFVASVDTIRNSVIDGPEVKIPTLAAKSAARMGHPREFSRLWRACTGASCGVLDSTLNDRS